MRKVYELDEHFFTGEATVQPVLLWGANGQPLRERFSKTASEASDYIQNVRPQAGKSIVLVLAMGAYETYGLNRNGDGFNEHPYRTGFKPTCGHTGCEAPVAWVKRGELLTDHYKSFETHGKIYRHHQNKDPSKASGDVIKAFWNPQMHRVELLLGIDNDKAPDLVQRIADGEYPAVSMGCKIKYDVCTICGHRAPTRAEYCDHLKFSMRRVMPSGLQAGALNPSPRFFDISFVIKPADQTGYMMKKVAEHGLEVRSSAELGEELDRLEEKRATIRKLSEIEKFVTGQTAVGEVSPALRAVRDHLIPVARRMPVIDDQTLRALSRYPLQNVFSTLHAAGVYPTTAEIIQLFLSQAAPGVRLPSRVLDAATFSQPLLLALLREHPVMLDQIQETGILDLGPENIQPEIAEKAQRYLEKRSTISEYLLRQLPASMREEERPRTDMLTVRDPLTGSTYRTNRGAAIDADDLIAKGQLYKLIGGGAAVAAAHRVATAASSPEHAPTINRSASHALKLLNPEYGPRVMSEEGISIPANTELVKSSSVVDPLVSSAAMVTSLAHDYESRLRAGEYVGDPDAPIHQRVQDRLQQMAADHPGYTFLSAVASHGADDDAVQKLSSYLGVITHATYDNFSEPTVNFDKVAYKIGALLWP